MVDRVEANDGRPSGSGEGRSQRGLASERESAECIQRECHSLLSLAMLPEEWSTRRLVVRPPELGDAEAIFQGWATDAEVTRYLTRRPNERIEETREFLNVLTLGTARRVAPG